MKRKVFIITLLVLELIMFFCFALAKVFTNLQNVVVLNVIYIIGEWFFSLSKTMMDGIHLSSLWNKLFNGEYVNLNITCSILVFNIIFIILYYFIFDILTLIINKKREKKVRKIVAPYELSSSEYDKFSYKHYLSRFPIKRVISLIVPVLFIFTFISIRFDKVLCDEVNSALHGNLYISRDIIEPFYNKLLLPIDTHTFFRNVMNGYVGVTNKIFNGFSWIEYILIVLVSILLIVIWYLFFTLLHLILRIPFAKLKEKKARRNYVRKMEYIEYKLRIKYKDETSIKSDDFMHIVEAEQKAAAKDIAKFRLNPEDESSTSNDSELKKKAYYEEIGQGVTDLGVSNEGQIDLDSPILERQVKYISDEEIEIILDEEPVIEVVEDEKEESNIEFSKDKIFFEKYIPDEIEIKTVEEYAGVSLNQENKDSDEENKEEVINNESLETKVEETETKEEVVEEKEPEIKEEPKEEVVETKEIDSSNELVTETKEDVILETEEKVEIKEEIHEEVNKINADEIMNEEESSLKDESVKENTEIKEENKEEVIEVKETDIKDSKDEVKEEKPTKVDPFAKWRGRKNAPGYGAKKVPSFKELQATLKEDLKKD